MTSPITQSRWTLISDRLTPVPVPFRLGVVRRGTDAQWFEERGGATRRMGCWIAVLPGLCGCMALLVLVMDGLGAVFSGPFLVVAFGSVLLGVICAWFIIWGSPRRRLMLWEEGGVVCLQGRGRGGRGAVRREVSRRLEECELRRHPVRLVIMRTRAGPVAHWEGFAAVVAVGDERFVLACVKTQAELEAYLEGSPAWVWQMDRGVGPLIEADAHRRVF